MKLKVLGSLGLLVLGGGAQAAGFSLLEQNASGLGNAFAGQAAVAADASTIYFNPAGMTQLQGSQVSIAGDYVAPSIKFSGGATPTPPLPTATGGDAGQSVVVPSLYFVTDIKPGLKFGIGVNAPFGMMTEYDTPWAGMTQGVKSELKTLNVNPSLAWEVNDKISFGIGVDWQKIDATLTSVANLSPLVVGTLKGNDTSWGWNIGTMVKLDAASRIGLVYRSKIDYQLQGTLNVLPSPAATADITTPDMASLSYFRTLSPTWDVLADFTWTGWSTFNELRVKSAVSGATVQLVNENWRDTMRYSLGLNYHQNDLLMWRFGVAYDETPVPDATHRTPRIPDNNRTWLTLGAKYKMTPESTVDIGYAHLFVEDTSINHTEGTAPAVTVTGTYSNSVDIVGVQFNHTF